jgi:hypothetical protein
MITTSTILAEQALIQAERTIGPDADPLLLELYARDVVWDRWRREARIPVSVAEAALRRIRLELLDRHPPCRPGEGPHPRPSGRRSRG